MKRLSALVIGASLILVVSAYPAHCQTLNPYAPMNAIAAEPLEPYNLWQIPQCSRTSYLPCPSPAPFAELLPDYPPAWAPFPGPFGLPVPVP
jgi:hypothetical protein